MTRIFQVQLVGLLYPRKVYWYLHKNNVKFDFVDTNKEILM